MIAQKIRKLLSVEVLTNQKRPEKLMFLKSCRIKSYLKTNPSKLHAVIHAGLRRSRTKISGLRTVAISGSGSLKRMKVAEGFPVEGETPILGEIPVQGE